MVTGETSCTAVNTGTVWAAVQLVARPVVGLARSGPGGVGVLVTDRRRRQLVAVTTPRGGRRTTAGGEGRDYRIELARRGACDQMAGGVVGARRVRQVGGRRRRQAWPGSAIWLQRSALEAEQL